MTDANLMDADCIHGEAWYECVTCSEEDARALQEYYNGINAPPEEGGRTA